MKLSEPLNTFEEQTIYIVEFRYSLGNKIVMCKYFKDQNSFYTVEKRYRIDNNKLIEVRKVEPNDPK